MTLIVLMLQAIYEAVDSRDSAARIFFADLSKGFGLIDHNILITELRNLEVSEIILGWISAFLVDRSLAVMVARNLSTWNTSRVGIPQGTKLGFVLFAVMTNSLSVHWHLRTKFVDDTSVVEISTIAWKFD